MLIKLIFIEIKVFEISINNDIDNGINVSIVIIIDVLNIIWIIVPQTIVLI